MHALSSCKGPVESFSISVKVHSVHNVAPPVSQFMNRIKFLFLLPIAVTAKGGENQLKTQLTKCLPNRWKNGKSLSNEVLKNEGVTSL